jgi:hypothetical protein
MDRKMYISWRQGSADQSSGTGDPNILDVVFQVLIKAAGGKDCYGIFGGRVMRRREKHVGLLGKT